MSFQVDSDVPFPRDKRVRECPYPWDYMKIGESFVLLTSRFKGKPAATAASLTRSAKDAGIAIKVRAIVGVSTDGEQYQTVGKTDRVDCTGLRVWRVAKVPTVPRGDDGKDDS